ncbi:MAG: hypothetical protein NVSMB9_04940 [Isosphaeraceae bacterium]
MCPVGIPAKVNGKQTFEPGWLEGGQWRVKAFLEFGGQPLLRSIKNGSSESDCGQFACAKQ